MSLIPGYVDKRSQGKTFDYSAEQQACLTVDEFEALLANYIVTTYHQAPHSGLGGQSPQQVWDKAIATRPAPKVVDIDRLVRAAVTPITRTLQGHKGVQIHNQFYNSPALRELYDQLCQQDDDNPEVPCIFSPLDDGQVWVTDPTTGQPILAVRVRAEGPAPYSPDDAPLPGSDEPFGYDHPLLVRARGIQAGKFKQADATKRTNVLNTQAIEAQVGLFQDVMASEVPRKPRNLMARPTKAQPTAPAPQANPGRDADMDQYGGCDID